MELKVERNSRTANGEYRIKAAGFTSATLYWADQTAPLADWSALARIPLSTDGTGCFSFDGSRAVPNEATHILARVWREGEEDYQDIATPLDRHHEAIQAEKGLHLTIMSDLHLSKKTWQVKKALSMAKDADLVLLAGDLVNDGEQRQFERMKQCIEEVLPDKAVFSVSGNHDYPLNPLPQIRDGLCEQPR